MQREPRPTPILVIRRRFEPNRLAPECLAEAYQRLVPLARRKLPAATHAPLLAQSQAVVQRKEAA